jgi:hypothetical protein
LYRTPCDTRIVHRIPSRVRGDRDPPLFWDETRGLKPLICGRRQQKNFRKSEVFDFSEEIGAMSGPFSLGLLYLSGNVYAACL